jgi:hypothetical protein
VSQGTELSTCGTGTTVHDWIKTPSFAPHGDFSIGQWHPISARAVVTIVRQCSRRSATTSTGVGGLPQCGGQGIAKPHGIGVSDVQMRRYAQGFPTHGRKTIDRGQCRQDGRTN